MKPGPACVKLKPPQPHRKKGNAMEQNRPLRRERGVVCPEGREERFWAGKAPPCDPFQPVDPVAHRYFFEICHISP